MAKPRTLFSDSDSDSSSSSSSYSHGGVYDNFKQNCCYRLLNDLLRCIKPQGNSNFTFKKVLIVDQFTLKIISNLYKLPDIHQEGVWSIKNINWRRQQACFIDPNDLIEQTMDTIYFIQPTEENVNFFLSDMYGDSSKRKDMLKYVPLYRKAFIFFSSPIPEEFVSRIKAKNLTLPCSRLGALREINLEFIPIDNQGFITNNERALEELFGDEEGTSEGITCLNEMANRIARVFALLKEFPYVRYRAAKSLDATTMTTARDIIPTKLAAGVWDCLMKYKKNTPHLLPETETYELLLILDRTVDQIASVIHEWTYDAMCHDLLNMEGNKYFKKMPGETGGPPEIKEVLLEDDDPVWLELRATHIADTSERLHEKRTNFISKNKAAEVQLGSRS